MSKLFFETMLVFFQISSVIRYKCVKKRLHVGKWIFKCFLRIAFTGDILPLLSSIKSLIN